MNEIISTLQENGVTAAGGGEVKREEILQQLAQQTTDEQWVRTFVRLHPSARTYSLLAVLEYEQRWGTVRAALESGLQEIESLRQRRMRG